MSSRLSGFQLIYIHVHVTVERADFWRILMTTTQVAPVATGSTRNPTVPLKHRLGCPSARKLFVDIMAKHDFAPIVRTLLREQKVTNEVEAQELVEAFIQWYATGSVTKTKSYVMFSGKVDDVLHAMILNSKWYMVFCYATTGVYTHHEPAGETDLTDEEIMEAATFTTRLLERTWGEDLNPYLQLHVNEIRSGNADVASVSCVSNGGPFDIVPVENQPF